MSAIVPRPITSCSSICSMAGRADSSYELDMLDGQATGRTEGTPACSRAGPCTSP
jgi:hypothetical protein